MQTIGAKMRSTNHHLTNLNQHNNLKKVMRNKTITICTIAVFLIFGSAVFAGETDFSGTWVLDKIKSEGLPPGMDQTMIVRQTGDKLFLETKTTLEQSEQTISDIYVLDGNETEFSPKAGALTGKGKRTAKLKTDGFEVQEAAIFDTPNGEVTVKISRKWVISSDRQTLIIEMTSENPNGTQKFKRVFNKQ